jgi:hypothetical protein
MTKFAADLAAAKATGPAGEQRSSIVPELSGQTVGLPGWSHFMPAERELSDRWVGRKRTETVEEMLNHFQVTAVRQAIRLPVHRYLIALDPMDADLVAVDLLASDLDVPLVGGEDEQRPGRRANRFSSRRHLDRALDALDYGHAVFEQAGRLDDAGYWRLTDLAPVPQWTIDDASSWEIDRHGRLIQIVQLHSNPPVKIPVDHLVTFTWQGKPGDPRGRALDPETPIPTPDGWRMMDDLQPGDRLFDEEGKIRHVVARQDWEDRPCYELAFSTGETIIADANHQWVSHEGRRRKPKLVTTEHMAKATHSVCGVQKAVLHAIPKAGPLEYVPQPLLVDPYVLGFWLGDGDTLSAAITTMDREVVTECERRGYPARELARSPSAKPTRADRYRLYGDLQFRLRALGVLGNKHVPEQYLRGSYQQRLDLLRGLMDSDGNVGGPNSQRGEFSNTNQLLSEAVIELVRGLGGSGRIRHETRRPALIMGRMCDHKDVWRVAFASPFTPFLMARKADRYDSSRVKPRPYHYVESATPVGNRRTVCIQTDAPSNLFLAGHALIPSHNSMLRPLTGAWIMSDRTMRVMGMSAERTGMGVPVGKVTPGAATGAKEAMERLLAGLAAGHDTNLVLESDKPIGDSLMLMGVTGQTPNLVEMLKYYDEAIARAMLAMLIQLGQTQTGSYALSGTFDDLLAMFHDTVIDWYCDVMTEQLVEPWMDRNRGEDAPAPRLVWSRREPAAPPPSSYQYDLDFGILTVDDRRGQLGLPPLPDGAGQVRAIPSAEASLDGEDQSIGQPAGVSARRSDRRPRVAPISKAAAMRSAFATAAGRELRREPFEHELAAATDFAELETEFVAASDDLATLLVTARDDIAAKAVDLVEAMEDVDPLTLGGELGPQLDEFAAAMDIGPIVTLLTATAVQGVSQVVGEAARQGVSITASIDYEARAEVEARELLRRMAVQITESCAAAARTAVPVQAARRGLARLRPARLATIDIGWLRAFLDALSPAKAEEAAAGATGRANGNGRYAALETAPVQKCYVSSLLDDAACEPCVERDGEEFDSVEEAEAEFPNGPNPMCEGMERCRCCIVAILEGEQETV